jgi:hypothetical protein
MPTRRLGPRTIFAAEVGAHIKLRTTLNPETAGVPGRGLDDDDRCWRGTLSFRPSIPPYGPLELLDSSRRMPDRARDKTHLQPPRSASMKAGFKTVQRGETLMDYECRTVSSVATMSPLPREIISNQDIAIKFLTGLDDNRFKELKADVDNCRVETPATLAAASPGTVFCPVKNPNRPPPNLCERGRAQLAHLSNLRHGRETREEDRATRETTLMITVPEANGRGTGRPRQASSTGQFAAGSRSYQAARPRAGPRPAQRTTPHSPAERASARWGGNLGPRRTLRTSAPVREAR